MQPNACRSTAAPPDTSPTYEPVVDAVPVLPLAAAVTDDEAPPRPRHRRSLALRFGVAFVLGLVLAVGTGAGVLYAWGQQYDGRILPGVRVGSTELGGLTREQAEAEIANAYGSLATGQITLTGPDGHTTSISYADLGRGPDTSALLDAALAAGRHGEPLANLIGAPAAAIHGLTIDSSVTYDRNKLAAAVETLATTIDRTPTDAFVSAGLGGRFSVSPAKDGRAVDKAGLLTALDQQLVALGTPESITMAVPVGTLTPAVTTASAEAAKAAANRMAADVVVARGEEHVDDPRQEPRAAGLVLDRGRRDHHAGLLRGRPRPDRQEAGQAGRPEGEGRGSQAGRQAHRRQGRQPRGPNARRRRHEGRAHQRDRGPPGGRGWHRRSRPSSRPSTRS